MNKRVAHHALLAGALLEEGLKQGGEALCERMVTAYAALRGGRMAEHARRDGVPTDAVAYNAYGEWAAAPGEVESSLQYGPACTLTVTRCPWVQAWREAGMEAGGRLYCRYVDERLVQAFDPSVRLEIGARLSFGDGCCRFTWPQLTQAESPRLAALKAQLGDTEILPWEAHCQDLMDAMGPLLTQEARTRALARAEAACAQWEARHRGEEAS